MSFLSMLKFPAAALFSTALISFSATAPADVLLDLVPDDALAAVSGLFESPLASMEIPRSVALADELGDQPRKHVVSDVQVEVVGDQDMIRLNGGDEMLWQTR